MVAGRGADSPGARAVLRHGRSVVVMNGEAASGESVVTNTSDDFSELEPDWSPDGRMAFHARAEPGLRQGECGSRCGGRFGADGTGAQELLTPDEGPCYKRHAAWSPDGRSDRLLRRPDGRFGAGAPTEIYLVRPDGTGLNRIPRTGRLPASQPDWSPSGSWGLACTLGTDPPRWGAELGVINSDGSNDRSLKVADFASVDMDERAMEPAWSPDEVLDRVP